MGFVEDSFSGIDGTALSAHTPEVGSAWSVVAGTMTIDTSGVAGQTFASGYALNDAAPPSADYDVEAIFNGVTSAGDGKLAVVARGDFDGNPWLTSGYAAQWDEGSTTWSIQLISGGGFTELDSYVDSGFTSGQKAVKLSIVGSTIELYVDAVLRCSTVDSTVTADGAAGLYIRDGHSDEPSIFSFVAGGGGGGAPGTHVLTGRGSTTIGGLEWLSVTIDTDAQFSFGVAEPPNYYHVGMLSWGTDNGVMRAWPITRFLELIQIPADMELLYYQFADGVTATVVELAAP